MNLKRIGKLLQKPKKFKYHKKEGEHVTMNKCLKITITVDDLNGFLHEVIKPHARRMDLEGVVQPIGPVQAKIIACGKKEKVDAFVDLLQKEVLKDIEIEPFSKDKDYRGVFRVVE